ncbi:acyl-CoA-like ligand-binding transcription factor [Streptomyces roseolilacinus]
MAQEATAARADRSGHTGRALRVVRLILRTPALRARFLEHQARWRDDTAAEPARRAGHGPGGELYPETATGMALTAFDTCCGGGATAPPTIPRG